MWLGQMVDSGQAIEPGVYLRRRGNTDLLSNEGQDTEFLTVPSLGTPLIT
jgi:hypothetical protein